MSNNHKYVRPQICQLPYCKIFKEISKNYTLVCCRPLQNFSQLSLILHSLWLEDLTIFFQNFCKISFLQHWRLFQNFYLPERTHLLILCMYQYLYICPFSIFPQVSIVLITSLHTDSWFKYQVIDWKIEISV